MKKFFTLVAAGLLASAMTAEARYWTYDWEAAVTDGAEIQPGVWYALQGGQSAADGGYYTWFNGTNHTTSQNLTTDNLVKFVEAGRTEDGSVIYYVQRYNGEYLYAPGQTNFYGTAVERAWKVTVKEALTLESDYEYSYSDPETEEETDFTGMAAYIAEWKYDGVALDLSCSTFVVAENLMVIAGAESNGNDGEYSTYTYLTGLGANATTGAVGKGTNYNTNTWVIFPATEQDARESLSAKMFELTEGTYEIDLSAYQLGNGAGEYSQEYYDKFMELWNRALEIYEGGEATDEEIDKIAEELEPALDAFRNSGKGLTEGYYILRSFRTENWPTSAYPYGRNGSGYDDGAIFDGSAVDPSDTRVLWSYKAEDDVEFYLEDIETNGYTYPYAKFVWHAINSNTKDKDGNDLYYFQNLETGRYIGKDSNGSQIVTTEKAEVAYTIAANPNFPGWFSFYSPSLSVHSEDSNHPADYSGIHCEATNGNWVVAWDWRVGASCWKVVTLTAEDVDALLAQLDGPKRLANLKKLTAQAEKKIEDGYTYAGYNADGTKSEYANSGNYEEVDGLVTDPEQLACPMIQNGEGDDLSWAIDGDASTYIHSTWGSTFAGDHFLQISLPEEESSLLFKWVKRGGTNDKGAPNAVEIWGTNSEKALEVLLDPEVEDASDKDCANYWQTEGSWTKLSEGTFDYKYAIDFDGVKNNAAGTYLANFDGGYKYLRLAVKSRVANGDVPGGNYYFHGAEVRVYRAALDLEASLITAVPENVLKALQDAIATAQEEIADEAATPETLEKLQKAYEEFLNYYPEPTRVTNALTAAEALANSAEEGDGLGYYADGSVDKLKSVIEDVRGNVKEVMTVEEISNLLAQLNAALDEFNAALKVPATGYYAITSKSSNENNYGRAICATTSSEKEALKLTGGAKEENTEARPGRYWLVEKVDGGYTYKNIFTGKYLHPVSTQTRNLALSAEPYVFAIQFAKEPGCFNLVLAAEDAVDGLHIYANADPAGVLVTWGSAEGRDNSAWEFQPLTADEIEEAVKEGVLLDVPFAAPQIFTFPVEIDTYDAPGTFYSVVGQSENFDIQLSKEEGTLTAGQPYVFVPVEGTGKVARFYLPEDAKLLEVKTTSVATNKNGLFGVFETTELPDNCGVFDTKHTEVLVSEAGETVAANTGYFAQMPEAKDKGDYTLKANGKMTAQNAGLSAIIVDNTKKNFIFTVSGVRMNSVNNLPAGLYIINGKKYIVK